MKYIKTYEGLFSFLKKKKGVKVTFDDILECLYDLTDESRIKNQLTSDAYWLVSSNLFVDEGIVFKNRGLEDDHDAFINDELYRDKNFKIRRNAISFNISYNPKEISDSEVNVILQECKSKLEISECKMSFFISWRWNVERNNDSGNIKKSQSDREWWDFMKMISLALPKTGYGHMRQVIGADRNITVKIETPAGFQ